ncbi:hypothetical protein LRAMOSA05049 [Lichtheimia ramosa]|uniref:RRM domain-containing protein n=1 Tax=Lichtheimia ramosa TaxID=688394 RepID=A0A077WZZ2_9FUNG|nr:hypothetical protein LRAMOSA05049 [Lichtheimia ramosa]
MDIDRPLDELIKKRNKAGGRKQQQQQKKTQQKNQRGGNKQSNKNQNKNAGGNGRRRNDKVKNGNNINLGVSNKSKKSIGKASGPRSNTNLSSRLGQQPKQTKPKPIDPASIVITKKVSRKNNNNNSNNNNKPLSMIRGVGQNHTQGVMHRGLSIRGASYGTSSSPFGSPMGSPSGGINIRGESGPATVVISNLDPSANAEDIRMICAQFGQVSHCEVLVDRTGRSFGEAEVEFTQKSAALDCIHKLDNEVADGRILRVTLRQRPTMVSSSYMNQTVRSVIAPTRSGFTSAH